MAGGAGIRSQLHRLGLMVFSVCLFLKGTDSKPAGQWMEAFFSLLFSLLWYVVESLMNIY